MQRLAACSVRQRLASPGLVWTVRVSWRDTGANELVRLNETRPCSPCRCGSAPVRREAGCERVFICVKFTF